MINDPDTDEFSGRERRALALWRAPEPPADLPARVMARLEAERGGARPVALAVLAAAVVGGLFALRLLSSSAASSSAGDARFVGGDGGSAAEVSATGDGVRS